MPRDTAFFLAIGEKSGLIAEAIRAYAEQAAGTEADLDEALENTSMEYLESAEKPQD